MSHEHKKDSDSIDMERFIQTLIDLCNHFAKDIITVFVIQVLSLVVPWLLLLRIVVYVDSIEWIIHVHLFQLST